MSGQINNGENKEPRDVTWKVVYSEKDLRTILDSLRTALPALEEINDRIAQVEEEASGLPVIAEFNKQIEQLDRVASGAASVEEFDWPRGLDVASVSEPLGIIQNLLASMKRLGMCFGPDDPGGEIEAEADLYEKMGVATWMADDAIIHIWEALRPVYRSWIGRYPKNIFIYNYEYDKHICLSIRGLDAFLQLAIGLTQPKLRGIGTPVRVGGGELTPCQQDCIRIIRKIGRRLTTTEVLEQLERVGRLHGLSTVKNALAW